MQIETFYGSIFDAPNIEIMMQQCNCFNTMGAGLARQIALRYPCAVDADDMTEIGDKSKLGSYTVGVDEKTNLHIVNVYSQYNYGTEKRQTDYIALKKALNEFIFDYLPTSGTRIAIPYKFGCGLAGGDWEIVLNIFIDVFKELDIILVICNNENTKPS